ncbi:hypothetical protein RJ640_030321 [Escallonia rubra]|uniref:FBD domain-containing protein n=1 Tax=Escallonia rubra TaxID=112253 RepID=A0AA88U5I4_9ASTE|nr:hypothetical protein RJ640_030321 [Escallonia rubra]
MSFGLKDYIPMYEFIVNLAYLIILRAKYLMKRKVQTSLARKVQKLSWSDHEFEREVEKAIGCPHPCLQVVEVVGFVGRTIDVELVMYLLEHAGKLERIVLNPAFPWTIGTPLEFIEFKETKAARECALQLKASVPRGAELVVL